MQLNAYRITPLAGGKGFESDRSWLIEIRSKRLCHHRFYVAESNLNTYISPTHWYWRALHAGYTRLTAVLGLRMHEPTTPDKA